MTIIDTLQPAGREIMLRLFSVTDGKFNPELIPLITLQKHLNHLSTREFAWDKPHHSLAYINYLRQLCIREIPSGDDLKLFQACMEHLDDIADLPHGNSAITTIRDQFQLVTTIYLKD